LECILHPKKNWENLSSWSLSSSAAGLSGWLGTHTYIKEYTQIYNAELCSRIRWDGSSSGQ
jgi:hypothetical protein